MCKLGKDRFLSAQGVLKALWMRFRLLLGLPLLGGIFFWIARQLVNPVKYPNSDFFNLWLAGWLVVNGQNPYMPADWVGGHHLFGAAWIPETRFIYPLPFAFFFVPLAFFPLYQAYLIWVTLAQFLILAAWAMLLRLKPAVAVHHYLLPLLAGLALFRPTIVTLVNGQFSGVLLFVTVAVIVLWQREKWWQGGALLPILALKPNLGVPMIAFLSCWLLLRRQKASLLAIALSGLALLCAGLAVNPHWLSEFWGSGNTKLAQTFGYSPTVWGVSAFLCRYQGQCSLGLGGVLALLFLGTYLYWLIKRQSVFSPPVAVSFAVILTLLLTPYTWPYDQLLLVIPILAATIGLAQRGAPYLPTALIFLAVDLVAFIFLSLSIRVKLEIWNISIPLLVFGLLIGYLNLQSQDRPLRV